MKSHALGTIHYEVFVSEMKINTNVNNERRRKNACLIEPKNSHNRAKKKEMKQNFFFFITAGVQPSSVSN